MVGGDVVDDDYDDDVVVPAVDDVAVHDSVVVVVDDDVDVDEGYVVDCFDGFDDVVAGIVVGNLDDVSLAVEEWGG